LNTPIPENPLEGFQGLDMRKYFLNLSQDQEFDLDIETLESRIEYCKSIK
jgi:hypothetical protein